MAEWHVVSMVSEPPQLVLAFVAHWLDRGAGHVHLYLDMENPALEVILARVPCCSFIRLDAAFWQGSGRPWPQSGRQIEILQRLYDAAPAEWLLHVDADEMLAPGIDLGAVLAAQPDDAEAVRLGVAERVHLGGLDRNDIFAGAFRRPAGKRQIEAVERLDGAAAAFLFRGLVGYETWKSLFRTARGLSVGLHGLKPPRRGAILPGALLHYDGLTPLTWVAKRERMLSQQPKAHLNSRPPRKAQLAHILRHRGNEVVQAELYTRLKLLSDTRAEGLRSLRLLVETGPDIRGALTRRMPEETVGLTADEFDAAGLPERPRRNASGLWPRARRRFARLLGAG